MMVALIRSCIRKIEWISSHPLRPMNQNGQQSALLLGNVFKKQGSVEMSGVYYRSQFPMGLSHFCLSCNKAEVLTKIFVPQHLCSKMSRVFSEWSVLEDRDSISVQSKGQVYLLAIMKELCSQSSDSSLVTWPTAYIGVTRQVMFLWGN